MGQNNLHSVICICTAPALHQPGGRPLDYIFLFPKPCCASGILQFEQRFCVISWYSSEEAWFIDRYSDSNCAPAALGVVEVGAQRSEGGSWPVRERAESASSVGGIEREGVRVSEKGKASKRFEDATQEDNHSG